MNGQINEKNEGMSEWNLIWSGLSLTMNAGFSRWPQVNAEWTRSFCVDISLFLPFRPASSIPDFLMGQKKMLVHQCSNTAWKCSSGPRATGGVTSLLSMAPLGCRAWPLSRGLAALQEVPNHYITSRIYLLFHLQFWILPQNSHSR